MNIPQILFFSYLALILLVSLIAFFLYRKDKDKAKKGDIRIKEKTLLMLSCYNGAFGSLIGRIIFHHKTDKKYFSLVIYFSLLIQLIAIFLLGYLAFFLK